MNFDDEFKRDQRSFRIFSRFVFGFIGFVFVLVIGGLVVQGYVAYKLVTDPSIAGKYVGEVVNGFNETVK